ncbi:unnamed protein product, partial [Sphagnum compactum]
GLQTPRIQPPWTTPPLPKSPKTSFFSLIHNNMCKIGTPLPMHHSFIHSLIHSQFFSHYPKSGLLGAQAQAKAFAVRASSRLLGGGGG